MYLNNNINIKLKYILILQKKNIEVINTASTPKVEKSYKINKTKIRQKKKFQKKHSRGIVYLGHIPHGFYEEQMTDYFKQFGNVTRVRVVRSKNVSIIIINLYII